MLKIDELLVKVAAEASANGVVKIQQEDFQSLKTYVEQLKAGYSDAVTRLCALHFAAESINNELSRAMAEGNAQEVENAEAYAVACAVIYTQEVTGAYLNQADVAQQAAGADEFVKKMTQYAEHLRGVSARVMQAGFENGSLKPIDTTETDH